MILIWIWIPFRDYKKRKSTVDVFFITVLCFLMAASESNCRGHSGQSNLSVPSGCIRSKCRVRYFCLPKRCLHCVQGKSATNSTKPPAVSPVLVPAATTIAGIWPCLATWSANSVQLACCAPQDGQSAPISFTSCSVVCLRRRCSNRSSSVRNLIGHCSQPKDHSSAARTVSSKIRCKENKTAQR